MLVTPANGIMLLASLAFLAIGLTCWLSVKRPDASARLWVLGFIAAGIAPLLGAFGGATVGPFPFIGACIALALSFVLFGLALKVLYTARFYIRDQVVLTGTYLLGYALSLAYVSGHGSPAWQIFLFSVGTGTPAVWAALQAIQLSQRSKSVFVSHLIFIFVLQALVVLSRIPQSLFIDTARLWEHSSSNEIILTILSLCGIIKAISYFGLRFEELNDRLESETKLLQEQAYTLAKKNSEIVSAMYSAPIACVVTSPSLEMLYANAQAERLLGGVIENSDRRKISDWTLGLRDISQVNFTGARHVLLVSDSSAVAIAAEITASVLDSESAASQWVFTLREVEISDMVIQSIWQGIPRSERRTWLACDQSGVILSAQDGWAEVLAEFAVSELPELHFGAALDRHNAAGLHLWESLRKFSGDNERVDHAISKMSSGQVHSVLLRDEDGNQLSCGCIPLRSWTENRSVWVIELSFKKVAGSKRSKRRYSRKAPSARPASDLTASAPDVPDFLRWES